MKTKSHIITIIKHSERKIQKEKIKIKTIWLKIKKNENMRFISKEGKIILYHGISARIFHVWICYYLCVCMCIKYQLKACWISVVFHLLIVNKDFS